MIQAKIFGTKLLQAFVVCFALCVTAAQAEAGWLTYGTAKDPFSIKYPSGWSVSSDYKTGRVKISDTSGSELSIVPFSLDSKLESAQAQGIFSAFLHSFSPDKTWSKPEVINANTLRSVHASANDKSAAVFVFQTGVKGAVGQFCIARMPQSISTSSANTFAEMLATLQVHKKLRGGAKELESDGDDSSSESAAPGDNQDAMAHSDDTASQADLAEPVVSANLMGGGQAGGLPPTPFSGYQTFTDPDENSFTCEVPVGWKIEGGMYRPRSIDARPWVKATSPDNMMVAFIGDGKIPPYTVPTAQGTMLGFGPGRAYNGTEVRSYTPARRYIEQYVRNSLKNYISDIQVVESHEHPDIAATMNGSVGATRSEASSIKFTGMYGNIPAVGYYLASTKLTVAYGTGMWWVSLIAGELSAADRAEGGLGVILHMLGSFKMNPVWKGQAIANAGQVSRNYTIQSQAVSRSIMSRYWSQQAANESIHSAYWNRQASQDRAANNFSDYIRGTQTVQDPDTGTNYKVNYGPQYHWIDPGGNVTGTNYSAPGPEWRQLMNVP